MGSVDSLRKQRLIESQRFAAATSARDPSERYEIIAHLLCNKHHLTFPLGDDGQHYFGFCEIQPRHALYVRLRNSIIARRILLNVVRCAPPYSCTDSGCLPCSARWPSGSESLP
jgi:hypothetical protein